MLTKLAGLEKPGPVAMAQQTSLSNRVTTRPAAENELNSRLSKIESRLELLESQVQKCQTLLGKMSNTILLNLKFLLLWLLTKPYCYLVLETVMK